MQSHSPVDNHIFLVNAHTPVHFLIAQAEHNGLVPHQCLIVRFTVTDHLFVGAADGEFIINMIQIPMLVRCSFQQADPHIRFSHGKAVVKANATLGNGNAQSGDGRHILRDQQSIRIDLPGQFCCQLQICHSFNIRIHGEIFAVVGKSHAQTVIMIEHRGNAIEPESIKMVLRQPVF